ncbi:hypothetical protein [Ruminococcus sp.]|uniref:hypothetical protein n=1 Tax=Ruminococcus sp. TaxID=41978 RepID=UPI0025F308FA|nr:hypothetical protein [Ruminococcus sp.]
MGNFFTSTQIYNNEKLGREEFIENFCSKMAEEGYIPCDDDESELSYILKFADNCNWVTITSESYGQGNAESKKDTGRLAKMLGTVCVNTVCIDSDCAILELYDKNGKKADTFTIGRADDYFGDDIPQPSEKIWKSFLSKDSSWEQFTQICSSDEVFVEDGVSKLAPIIGMDSCNINFSAEDADEIDTNCVFLDFKSARSFITMSKNGKTVETQPKKLTLNAAFKQLFGEALEPLGFKAIKCRYPYLVRVINNEILHIITFAKVIGSETKFIIYSGVATIYRNEINFDQSILFNTNWLSDTKKYWMKNLYEDPDGKSFFEKQSYYSFDDNETLLSALELALRHLKKYVLPVLDSVNSLKECIKYFWCYNSNLRIYSFDEDFHNEDKNNEGLLYFVIDDHSDMMNEFAYWSDLEKKYAVKYGSNLNSLENYIDTINDFRIQQIQKRDKIYNNASDYEKTMEEIKNRMKKNNEYLASKI